jgi:S-adenosylmethionine uptake transporter
MPAIGLGLLAMALLCSMDGIAKHLLETNAPLMVTFGRYAMSLMFATVVFMLAKAPRLMFREHALRGVMIASAGYFFFVALAILPIVLVFTISFLAPLLAPFLAQAFLRESIKPRNLIGGLLGFTGVLISVWGSDATSEQPEQFLWGVVAALISTLSYAASIILMRKRAQIDSPALIGFLGALIPAAIFAVPALILEPFPSKTDWPAFAIMGMLGAGGIYALSKAYAIAEAQVVAPLDYTALIGGAAIGVYFFNEVPSIQVLIGSVVVIFSCLWSNYQRPKNWNHPESKAG